ncbi:LysR family transcriptional regulator [Aliidiomarina haloalkalitolerans]|uniref:LysR family transcriptional regulator n=1 Tax=Aliidiomarina haloalkalitolerans TaxID=859059 RepID=A0A432VSZ3_9GAMM|nr:LysR family transcriptional regulator [Aliidiomarina haloalkalitolerans]RUO19525.1 LysR family transcriptional regulator [Aliidiomarina haloalkalitolerans]
MKIWPLRVLTQVVESGSLQAAANALHRTAPALSLTLSKLEDDVGFAILDRSGYRLQLTAEGQQFLRHAYELLRQHDRLNSVVAQLRDGAEPQLHVGYDYSCNPDLLLPAVHQIQQAFPVTEVLIAGHSQLQALQHVREGRVELALTPWLPTFQQMADFESLRLGEFQLVVVMARRLVEQHGMPTSRNALSEIPHLLPKELNMGISPEQIYRLSGSSRLRVNDAHTMVQFLRAGVGWGVIPRDLVRQSLVKGELVEVDIPGFLDHIHAEIHLVKLASTQLGPAGTLLWESFVAQEHHC